MSMLSAPKFSILSDSISTLNGFTPMDTCFYHNAFSRNTGIATAQDTWWMKVIEGLGGTLLINNSHAGSTVCRNGYQAASTPWRIAKLRKGETLPDYVLVYSGLNDVAFCRSPEEFQCDYSNMLLELNSAYPAAQIWCGTLCRGFLQNPDFPLFVNFNTCMPLALYNQSIREAVREADCHLADLAAFEQDYASIDGVHPNAAGMEQLAQMWLRCMIGNPTNPLSNLI